MTRPLKTLQSSVAKTLRSHRHFLSSGDTAKKETKVVETLRWPEFVGFGVGYFVIGPFLASDIIEKATKVARKEWMEIYGQSAEIDDLLPGNFETLLSIWSTLRGNGHNDTEER